MGKLYIFCHNKKYKQKSSISAFDSFFFSAPGSHKAQVTLSHGYPPNIGKEQPWYFPVSLSASLLLSCEAFSPSGPCTQARTQHACQGQKQDYIPCSEYRLSAF